eukprot:TRINITY_DN90710_c0_g1_i1.p1 TRINITY_DN90710_c0_g1~~TRINITY_DN90710_c0_g1_i1.p1  ORF type:complete len:374 (-),score=63.68 TRINITY_DN90710_c0_g1_i1:19-1089(-)
MVLKVKQSDWSAEASALVPKGWTVQQKRAIRLALKLFESEFSGNAPGWWWKLRRLEHVLRRLQCISQRENSRKLIWEMLRFVNPRQAKTWRPYLVMVMLELGVSEVDIKETLPLGGKKSPDWLKSLLRERPQDIPSFINKESVACGQARLKLHQPIKPAKLVPEPEDSDYEERFHPKCRQEKKYKRLRKSDPRASLQTCDPRHALYFDWPWEAWKFPDEMPPSQSLTGGGSKASACEVVVEKDTVSEVDPWETIKCLRQQLARAKEAKEKMKQERAKLKRSAKVLKFQGLQLHIIFGRFDKTLCTTSLSRRRVEAETKDLLNMIARRKRAVLAFVASRSKRSRAVAKRACKRGKQR